MKTAQIIALCPAPAPLVDQFGNIIVAYALIEFDDDPKARDVVPVGSDGGCFGLPGDLYYEAHRLGDDRHSFARFADPEHDDCFRELS